MPSEVTLEEYERLLEQEELEAQQQPQSPVNNTQLPEGHVTLEQYERMLNGDQQQSFSANPNTEMNFTNIALRQSLGQGALLGFGDEIEAAVRAPFSDRNYNDILDDIRHQNKEFETANPKTAIGAQIAGGVGSAFLPAAYLARAAQAARAAAKTTKAGKAIAKIATTRGGELAVKAGQYASLLPNTARMTAGKLGMAKEGARLGAIYGGVSGFGMAEDGFGDRVSNAAKSAVLGGAAGGVVAPAIGGVAKGVRSGLRFLRQSEADNATDMIVKAFDRDGIAPNELRASMRKLAPRLEYSSGKSYGDEVNDAIFDLWAKDKSAHEIEQTLRKHGVKRISLNDIYEHLHKLDETFSTPRTLVDIAGDLGDGTGRNLHNLLETAMKVPGEGQAIGYKALLARQETMRDRLSSQFLKAADVDDLDAVQRQAVLKNDLAEFAGPEYEKLKHVGSVRIREDGPTSAILQLRKHPEFRRVEDLARRIYEIKNNSAFDKFRDNVNENNLNFDIVNEIQKMLADGAKVTPTSNNTDRVQAVLYRTMRDKFLNTVQDSFPGFKALRQKYQDAVKVIEAGELGQKAGLKTSKVAREAALEGGDLTGAQRAEFAHGVVDDALTTINRAKPSHNVASRFNDRFHQKRLDQILGPENAQKVMNKIQQEDNAARRMNEIIRSSRTGPIQAGIEDVTSNAAMAADLMQANAPSMIRRSASHLANIYRENTLAAVAEKLTEMNPQQVIKVIDELDKINPILADKLRNMGTGTNAGAAIALGKFAAQFGDRK